MTNSPTDPPFTCGKPHCSLTTPHEHVVSGDPNDPRTWVAGTTEPPYDCPCGDRAVWRFDGLNGIVLRCEAHMEHDPAGSDAWSRIGPPFDSLAPLDRCHTPACSRPHLDGEAWCDEHHPLSAIQPPSISNEPDADDGRERFNNAGYAPAEDWEMAPRPMIRDGERVIGYLVRKPSGERVLVVPDDE